MEQKTRLLFSNLAVECGEEYLRQWIEGRGYSVLNVQLIQDLVSHTSPSFAYVELTDSSKLDEVAHTLHGGALFGRALRVCKVVPLHVAVPPRFSASA
jgi:hypothetical protein